MAKINLKSLGANVLCSIDTETTGLKPDVHEIIQIAIMPLTFEFEPHPTHRPFIQLIKPENLDAIPDDLPLRTRKLLAEADEFGSDAYEASCTFELWFTSLELGNGKLSPLASNWPYDAAMILNWLSADDFYAKFHGHYRDLMCMCNMVNDRAEAMGEPLPFPKLSLGSIAKRLNVDFDPACLHEAYYDCLITARAYRALLAYHLPNF